MSEKQRLKARLTTSCFISSKGKYVQKKELYLYKTQSSKELIDIFNLFVSETDGMIAGINFVCDGDVELICTSCSDDEIDFKVKKWIE